MQKYRVLKSYPKQITNSGRLVTLKPGAKVYLKKEAQVLRLVRLGFLKPVVEMPRRKKPESKPKKQAQPESKAPAKEPEQKKAEDQSDSSESKEEYQEHKRRSKSEYLNKKKNKGKAKDE